MAGTPVTLPAFAWIRADGRQTDNNPNAIITLYCSVLDACSGNYIVETGIAIVVIAVVIVLTVRHRRRIAQKNLSIYNLMKEQYRLERKLEEEQTKNKVLTEIMKSK